MSGAQPRREVSDCHAIGVDCALAPLGALQASQPCISIVQGGGKYTNSTCTATGSGEYEVSTRTRTLAYDEAGRVASSEETSNTSIKGLPKVTITEEVGNVCEQTVPVRCVKQSTTENGVTQTVRSVYNTLGQLVLYTDADGVTAKYEYENGGDARLVHIDDGKGTQAYTYDPVTSLLTKLIDMQGSNVLTFAAGYDIEGKMTSETYPNGMNAAYVFNAASETTGITYTKMSHCTEKCVWFSENTIGGIHGETISAESSLAKDAYTYDSIGRLTQVQETPGGKDCTARLYAYDIESDRTSLTTRESATSTCPTEGGTVQTHTYDEAGRLSDEGVTYDAFGNTTILPAADAGGHELQTGYYLDGQVQTQTQNGQINKYNLDPVGRVRQTITEGTANASVIDHYAGPGEALSWKDEGESHYTRLVPGIGGSMAATEHNGQEAILQLHDLKGNIVAEAHLSETATELTSTYNSSEFGVPTTSKPPEYTWLGASGISSGLPTTGIITTGQGSYVPEIGRPLQTEPAIPPVFPSGLVPASAGESAYLQAEGGALKGIAMQQEIEEQTAKRQQAEEQASLAQCPASTCGPWPEEGGATCNEEVEGCGPDPEHGRNPWGCKVWVSWGHGLHLNEYLAVHGHWSCSIAPADIEIEIALLEVVRGKYVMAHHARHSYTYPGEGVGPTGKDFSKGWTCTANKWYQAWVWGRTWDAWTKKTTWYATAEDGHWDQCPEGVEDPTQGPDQFGYK